MAEIDREPPTVKTTEHRKRQFSAGNVHAAEFGATVQGGEPLAGGNVFALTNILFEKLPERGTLAFGFESMIKHAAMFHAHNLSARSAAYRADRSADCHADTRIQSSSAIACAIGNSSFASESTTADRTGS